MKALTLRQPWASLVAVGAKRIETRSWLTKYRGPLAIHAAATRIRSGDIRRKRLPPEIEKALLPAAAARVAREWPGELGRGVPVDPWYVPYGAVVAIADLVDVAEIESCDWNAEGWMVKNAESIEQQDTWRAARADVRSEIPFGDFRPGRFAWLLTNVQPLALPRPARGALSLWDWEP